MGGIIANSNVASNIVLPSESTPDANGLYAGKFKTQEDLVKGLLEASQKTGVNIEDLYKQVESGIGKLPTKETTSADVSTGTKVDITDPRFKGSFEKGALSSQELADLKAAGYTDTLIDTYMTGVRAARAAQEDKIIEGIGGKEEYSKMIAWANAQLSAEEQASFNAILDSGDIDKLDRAVRDLYHTYLRVNGAQPSNLIRPQTAQKGLVSAYKSVAELTADMRDPRYKKDTAYRSAVAEKLSRSNIL